MRELSFSQIEMPALASRWIPFVGLICVLTSADDIDYHSVCSDRILILRARYAHPSDRFSGYVSLDVTFAVIEVSNASVEYSYPRLPVGDARIEIDFLRRQREFMRLLQMKLPNVSNVSVSYSCYLAFDFSCDLICVFDDKYVRGSEWKVTGSNIDDDAVADLCAKGHLTSLLRNAWEEVRTRWHGVCAEIEKRRDQMTISFRYDPRRRSALCNVSLVDPVSCRMIIENLDARATDPKFCKPRGDATVGVAREYPIEIAKREVVLTCLVSTDFIEKTKSLRLTNRSEDFGDFEVSGDGFPAEPVAECGADLGLIVGLSCAAFCATVIVLLLWRRRRGSRSLTRTTRRVVDANA